MEKRIKNSEKHPEAWAFYIAQARNIVDEPTLNKFGKYRIPEPNRSGSFIYADKVEELWSRFIEAWYTEDINSESVYGKIQYIVNHF